MLIAYISLLAMAGGLSIAAYRRGNRAHVEGLKVGKRMLFSLLPILLSAYLIAGLLEVMVPPQLVETWLGTGAGWKGLFIGTAVGAMVPVGPYAFFPIVASIFKAGTSIGTAVAVVTGWAMLGVGRLPYEIAFLGPRFTMVRFCMTLAVPPLAGALAQLLFGSGF